MMILAVILALSLAFPALAADPCSGAVVIANLAYNDSLTRGIDAKARGEGLSGDALLARADALRRAPTPEIQAQATAAKAAADAAKTACQASAPHGQ